MVDRDLKMREEDLVVADNQQLGEIHKASHSAPSGVPEVAAKKVMKEKHKTSEGHASDKMSGKAVGESKMSMIQAMIEKMNSMKKEELAASYAAVEQALSIVETDDSEGQATVDVVRAGHKITSEDIDIKEDIKALFAADDTLSEEFKNAATTIFEAAVVSKVNEQLEMYVIDIESQINEEKERLQTDMAVKLDQYLDYVVEGWMEVNKLAVQRGIKSELVDDFISGLKNLFNEHYIEIPEDKVDVVEELATRAEELEARLDDQLKKNAELKASLSEHKKADLFAEACDSLTETQKEKLAVLAEGIEFVNEEKFVEKLQTLKNSYFSESVESTNSVSGFDNADPLEEEVPASRLDPEMSTYVSAITRTLKR